MEPSVGPLLPGAADAGSGAAPRSCCARALQALAAAGADPPCCSEGAPRRKGLYDMATGRLFPHRTGRAHIVDRRTLGAELVAEAERLHPRAITFHFDASLKARGRRSKSCSGSPAARMFCTSVFAALG
jgi:hypothetical protein